MTNFNVVDWEYAPDWANYLGVHIHGAAHWFEEQPTLHQGSWAAAGGGRIQKHERAFYTNVPMFQEREQQEWRLNGGMPAPSVVLAINAAARGAQGQGPLWVNGGGTAEQVLRLRVAELECLLAERDREVARLRAANIRKKLLLNEIHSHALRVKLNELTGGAS